MKLIAALLLGFAGVAAAQNQTSGWYAGVGYGEPFGDQTITSDFSLAGSASPIKLLGGFRWNANWGLELAYVGSAAFDRSTTEFDLLLEQFTSAFSTEIAALTIRPMAYLPMSWGTVFGGLGFFEGDDRRMPVTDSPLSFATLPASLAVPASGATLLLGTEWPVGSLRLRAEYEWWDLDRAENASFGLGLSYRF